MSTGMGRTEIVAGPFSTREEARELEQKVQAVLDAGGPYEGGSAAGVSIPGWAAGVRVEEIQNDVFALVATEDAR